MDLTSGPFPAREGESDNRHSRASGNLVAAASWTPAFAGVTMGGAAVPLPQRGGAVVW